MFAMLGKIMEKIKNSYKLEIKLYSNFIIYWLSVMFNEL
jgi:hypothetical protein